MVCSSTLANIFSPEYPSGGEQGSFSGFLTRVSFEGGTGEFSHQSIPSRGTGGKLLLYFLFMGPGRGPARCLAIDGTIDGGRPGFASRKYM